MNVKIKNPKKLEKKIRTKGQERCNLDGRKDVLWSSFGEDSHGEKYSLR
jgi:ribosomal protein S14